MVGIVVVTHGKFAEGILDSLQLIVGPQTNIGHVGLFEGDDVDGFKESVYQAIVSNNNGEGVLVYVDLFGASPFNAVGSQLMRLQEANVDVRAITGVNLPMLLETATLRESMDLDSLYKKALETGAESIVELKEMMGL